MQYSHWLMVAGAVLVVLGIFGLAFALKRSVEPDEDEENEARLTPAGLKAMRSPI